MTGVFHLLGKKMIKHIIFDLDGVLLDAVEIHQIAFIEAYNKITKKELSIEQHFNELNGLPTKTKLEKLGIFDQSIVEKISGLKQELTLRELHKINEDIELLGICAILKTKKYKLSCASNSIRDTVYVALRRLGILRFFNHVVSNQDVKQPKPSPECYFQCILHNMVGVDETLVIEDSPVGAKAIELSGCYGLMVKNRAQLTLEKILEGIKYIEDPRFG
jgi:beta-phosphoglucomutase